MSRIGGTPYWSSSELARMFGMTRQGMQQFLDRNIERFPPTVEVKLGNNPAIRLWGNDSFTAIQTFRQQPKGKEGGGDQ